MTLAIAIGFSASAQYDLEAIELRTMSTTNGEVPPNVPLILTLVFENTGTQDIPDQSTARLLFINGLDTFQDIIGTFNGAMPVGAQISFNSDPVTLPAAPPIANLCGFILMDSTWAETDSTNNLVCETLQVSSSAVVDLKAQRVIVNAPNDLDGFDIDNGDEDPNPITDVQAVFTNEGNVIFPAGFVIPYTYSFDGLEESYFGTLATDLAPGDSTIRPSVDPSFNVPTEAGDFEICVTMNYNDSEAGNNETCWEWTMIDSYVPPPPFGVEEGMNSNLKIYSNAGNIQVTGIIEPINLTVMDMSGKIVANNDMQTDGILFMTQAAKGVYMIQATNMVSGDVSTHKLSLQ